MPTRSHFQDALSLYWSVLRWLLLGGIIGMFFGFEGYLL